VAFPGNGLGRIGTQRVAAAMLEFGVLSPRYAAAARQATLARSMVSPG
jgi:hypothetical protein